MNSSRNNTDELLDDRGEIKVDKILLACLYSIILILGLIGNGLVIYYFGFKKRNRQLFDFYILNLGLADLIASTVTSIHYLYNIIMANYWLMGVFMCKTISVIGPLTVNVSAWIVTSIALERCRGITKPFQRCTKFKIRVFMLVIWIVSALTLIPYIQWIDVKDYKCSPYWKSSHYEFTYSVVTLVVQSIIPTCTMCYIFLTIKKVVVHRNRNLTVLYTKSHSSHGDATNLTLPILDNLNSIEQRSAKKNRRMFIMLSFTLFIFILCSLPYNIFYSTSLYLVKIRNNYDIELIDTLTTVNEWLSLIVVMNSSMNFFIYAGMDDGFKTFCKRLIIKNKKNEQIVIDRRRAKSLSLSSRKPNNVKKRPYSRSLK